MLSSVLTSSTRFLTSAITQPAKPDRDPAHRRAEELGHCVSRRHGLAHRRGHRHLVGDQRGRVVDQALALDDVHQPPRRPDAAHDRRRRNRIGRRDDCAEHERHRPGQIHQLVGDDRDRPRGRQNQADRLEGDHPGIRAQAAQVGEEGGRVEQRRQEDEQNQVGIEDYLRHPGQEAQHQAAEDQGNRVRDLDPVGERVQAGGRDEQRCDDDLEIPHPLIVPRSD
ncbi:MAG TPA: hypothetical protein VFL56_04215 [Solirubrobacterales bacterium]|nr:hypothetical protein [Solirubrobacterales bacterium]